MYDGVIAETIGMVGYNGDVIEAYYARPITSRQVPSVLFLHHMPGWDEWSREACRKLASYGYATLAPHLFHRLAPGDWKEAVIKNRATGGLPDAQALGDMDAGSTFLLGQPGSNGKLGVIGFSIGGRLAMLGAAKMQRLDAAVNCWGGGVSPTPEQLTPFRPVPVIDMFPEIDVPVMGIFGKDDTGPTMAQVDVMKAELERLDKPHEWYCYDNAGHDIFCTDKPEYKVELAPLVWGNVFDFFGKHLGSTQAGA